MVTLEPVAPEPIADNENGWRALLANHLAHDAARLHMLIERHRNYTNSARARMILENWDRYLPKFVKIMPIDYAKSLKTLAASRAHETDEATSFKVATRG